MNKDGDSLFSQIDSGESPQVLIGPKFALFTQDYDQEKLKLKAFEAGIDYVIRKPIQATEIMSLLQKFSVSSSY